MSQFVHVVKNLADAWSVMVPNLPLVYADCQDQIHYFLQALLFQEVQYILEQKEPNNHVVSTIPATLHCSSFPFPETGGEPHTYFLLIQGARVHILKLPSTLLEEP